MSATSEEVPWYFACDCGAKFFDRDQTIECPRCGADLTSPGRIQPPWRKKLLTVDEASKLLTISKSKLYAMCERSEIDHRRVGGSIRFTDEDIAKFLEEAKRAKEARGRPTIRKQTPRRRGNFRHINF